MMQLVISTQSHAAFCDIRLPLGFWTIAGPGPGEFIAILLTVKLQKSMSGMERTVRMGVGQQPVCGRPTNAPLPVVEIQRQVWRKLWTRNAARSRWRVPASMVANYMT